MVNDRKLLPYWVLAALALVLPFSSFLMSLFAIWRRNEEFSYGILIPAIVAFLVWKRLPSIQSEQQTGWIPGLWITILGCGLQILGSLSGTLLLCGIAFTLTVMGVIAFLWGKKCLRALAAPCALLILMVPLPSYAVGELSWHLQSLASTVSGTILRLVGVPVYQDGNLLRLSNYVLEVKQACSGSRSIFALLALACVLAISSEKKLWIRGLLVIAAPVLAVGANVVRIVGTGMIASRWGDLAADESLHAAWGILVFLIAAMGLLGLQRILRWTTNEYA